MKIDLPQHHEACGTCTQKRKSRNLAGGISSGGLITFIGPGSCKRTAIGKDEYRGVDDGLLGVPSHVGGQQREHLHESTVHHHRLEVRHRQ